MTHIDYIPDGYQAIRVVGTYDGLFSAHFNRCVNAVLLPRRIDGDFDGLAKELYGRFSEGRVTGGVGRVFFLDDLQNPSARNPLPFSALEAFYATGSRYSGLLQMVFEDVALVRKNGLKPQLRVVKRYAQEEDTESFHCDSVKDRVLTCYNAPVTQWVRNEDVESLDRESGEVLTKEGSPVFSFRPGDIWRQAGFSSTQEAPPFIHRAVRSETPRLLLVAD